MNIIMVASEMTPFAKTGGLADVIGSLPYALARRGHLVTVFLPFYRCIEVKSPEFVLHEQVPIGQRLASFALFRIASSGGVTVYAVRREEYFDRSYLYGTPEKDYEDNAERFIFFSKAVLRCIEALRFNAHILHLHDWQTALIPAYVNLQTVSESLRRCRTVFTIHNLAYQGIFDAREFGLTHLPSHLFSPNGLEFYGKMNFMKGGIFFATSLTTVSRRYAQEIQTPDYGCGLDGVLRSRQNSVYGIMNGVDYKLWNPQKDPFLIKNFGISTLAGKKACKRALAKEMGIKIPDTRPLFGIVTRFAQQKGMDILLQALPPMLKQGICFAILGSGDRLYEKAMDQLASTYPSQFGLKLGFNEALAHRLYAGSDFLLMPSLYEPCGLSQLYALRYGTIPIVRATGGLDDSIQSWNPKRRSGNGFKFDEPNPLALLTAVDQALKVYAKPATLLKLQTNAMAADFSWEKSAAQYETLYQSIQPNA